MPAHQARYWIATVPRADWVPRWPIEGVTYIKGQAEVGGVTDYVHWQFVIVFDTKVTLTRAKQLIGLARVHLEPTVSKKALDYVHKDETAIEGTRFEHGITCSFSGTLPIHRAKSVDWQSVWDHAKAGFLWLIIRLFELIPPDIRVRCWHNINRIRATFLKPVGTDRRVRVYWGATGSGKSHLAWLEAGFLAYAKDPCTKWWDGYQSEESVIVDEFRGSIGISHVLRWFDKYPVRLETKGGVSALCAKHIWITSNLHPSRWYPSLDDETVSALIRRLEIHHFDGTLLGKSHPDVECSERGCSGINRPPPELVSVGRQSVHRPTIREWNAVYTQ